MNHLVDRVQNLLKLLYFYNDSQHNIPDLCLTRQGPQMEIEDNSILLALSIELVHN